MQANNGFAFSDQAGLPGNTCSAANLHTMVDAATFANMVLTDFSDSQRPIYVSGSAPSDQVTGQLWFQTNIQSPSLNTKTGLLLGWSGTQWTLLSEGFIGINKSTTVPIDRGMAVSLMRPTASYSVGDQIEVSNLAFPFSAPTIRSAGIAIQDIAVGASGIVISRGFAISESSVFIKNGGSAHESGAGFINGFNSLTVTTGSFVRGFNETNIDGFALLFVTGLLKK